ncbi:hypothetical protein [Polaribacter aquimarinus]|uniref:Uncharacterized protein n=1 Tax=Polaribacter aquimarinus TaxID=2100726 RepID=A0A2U2J7L5_9FLAO|nr:hypothetical protein [Polaribacter aquimarinus]PWG04328.1 hypothetical protein DIS07_13040 [Polaribacter aquimarinus]
MKKYIKCTFLLLLIIFTNSCNFEKLKTLEDDFIVTITPEPVTNKKKLVVVNYEDDGQVPDNLKIEFSGTYSDFIYRSDGVKDFKFDDNELSIGLGLNSGIKPSASNPIELTAKISAPGFQEEEFNFTLNSQTISSEVFKLKSLSYIPVGKVETKLSTNLVGGKVSQDIVVKTDGFEDIVDVDELVIPKATEFFDENGESTNVSEIEIQMDSYEPDTDSDTHAYDAHPSDEDLFEDGDDSNISFKGSNKKNNSKKELEIKNKLISKNINNAYWHRYAARFTRIISRNGVSMRFRRLFINIPLYRIERRGRRKVAVKTVNPSTGKNFKNGEEAWVVKAYPKRRGSGYWYFIKKATIQVNRRGYASIPTVIYDNRAMVTAYIFVPPTTISCDKFEFKYAGVPVKNLALRATNKFTEEKVSFSFKNFWQSTFKSRPEESFDGTINSQIIYDGAKYEFNLLGQNEKFIEDIITFRKRVRENFNNNDTDKLKRNLGHLRYLYREYYRFRKFTRSDNDYLISYPNFNWTTGHTTISFTNQCDVVTEISNLTNYQGNSQVKKSDIKFQVECAKRKLALKNNGIYYRLKDAPFYLPNTSTINISLFGFTDNEGKFVNKVPVLEDNKEYIFYVYWGGRKETEPILGSKINAFNPNFDFSTLCDYIDSQI